MPRKRDLQGSSVLVTGAGAGIGRALAIALHAKGAKVAVADIDLDRAQGVAGELDGALAVSIDVTDEASCHAAVEQVIDRFGSLDVVVANAGLAPPTGTMRTADPDEFDAVLAVNLTGTVNTVRAALPAIVAARGHVVIISSIYASFNGVLATPYAMSKAAVEALGRSLRVELTPHGASAGVVYLGFVDTGLVDKAFAAPGVTEVRSALPSFTTNAITTDALMPKLVTAIERRKPSFRAPGWVTPFLLARGIVGPVSDALLSRGPKVRRGIAAAERAADPSHD